jgi:hypothetical protein
MDECRGSRVDNELEIRRGLGVTPIEQVSVVPLRVLPVERIHERSLDERGNRPIRERGCDHALSEFTQAMLSLGQRSSLFGTHSTKCPVVK